MELTAAIRSDRATRQFTDEPIRDEEVKEILDLARQSGSGKNTQPWEFIVVSDRERLSRLSTFGTYTSPLTACAAGILIIVDADAPRMTAFDCGRLAQNLMLAAADCGLGTVPQSLSDSDDLRELLALPDNKEILIGIALGYPMETDDDRIEGKQKKEVLASMGRRDLEGLVHWEQY